MNLDQRSVRLNTEMGLLIESKTLANAISARFDALTLPENAYEVLLAGTDSPNGKEHLIWRTQENSATLDLHKDPARNGWQRFQEHFLTLLPLDEEL